MRIVDALVEVLKENESLTYKEAYLKICFFCGKLFF